MNALELRFQPLAPADFESLFGMMREFYVHEEMPFDETVARQALLKMLDNDSLGRVFLIYAGGEIAGYTVLTFGYSLEFHGRDAFVDELFLREKYRGQGIGQQTLEFLSSVCAESGVKALHLEVDHKNNTAQQTYRKFGFKDHDRYLMTKWLTTE